MGLFKSYKNDYENAQADIAKLKEFNDALNKGLSSIRSDNAKLEASLKKSQEEVADLRQKLSNETSAKLENITLLKNTSEELQNLKVSFENLNKELAAEKLKSVKDTIAAFEKAIKEGV